MKHKQEHVDFDRMNDWMDGDLDETSAHEVEEHIARCEICSAQKNRVVEVIESARSLPKSVLPPDDLWPDIKTVVNARKQLVLPTSRLSTTPNGGSTSWQTIGWRLRGTLAMAAVILVVLTSAITTLVLRRSHTQTLAGPKYDESALRAPVRSTPALPVAFMQAEAEYKRAIDELRLAVDTQRSQLNPETVRTVDRSLAVVDSAIAEARAALVADPGNRTLVDLLSASYQRKLDLLRRTSELGSRI